MVFKTKRFLGWMWSVQMSLFADVKVLTVIDFFVELTYLHALIYRAGKKS